MVTLFGIAGAHPSDPFPEPVCTHTWEEEKLEVLAGAALHDACLVSTYQA